jgi:hypothetical protein
VPVEVAGVAVVVPHERLGAAQDAALRVFKSGGDDALELEREDVRSLARVIMELVADVHEEVVCLADFLKSVVRDEPVIDKFLEIV